jgi:hypothetical protein
VDGSIAWFDITPRYRVLEIHEHLTAPGPALELHWFARRLGSWSRGGHRT